MMKEPLEAQMRLCADFRAFVGETVFYSGLILQRSTMRLSKILNEDYITQKSKKD